MHFEKIKSAQAQKRKVRCDDDVSGEDLAVFRHGVVLFKVKNTGVFVNRQILCKCIGEFQRMELSLVWKANRSGHRERQRQLGRLPKKEDFDEATRSRIKAFLGPWPRALEAAGLKEAPPKPAGAKKRRTARKLITQRSEEP